MVRQADSAQGSSLFESGEEEQASTKPAQGGAPVKSSHIIEEHIDVGIPRQTARSPHRRASGSRGHRGGAGLRRPPRRTGAP